MALGVFYTSQHDVEYLRRHGVERTYQSDSRPKASVMPTTPQRRGDIKYHHPNEHPVRY